jgi:tRNA pseudouridine55 synthase
VTGLETSRSGLRPEAEAVTRALAALTGRHLQMPPAFSAKKVGGRRAYAMAREATPVELTPAPVTVSRADLLEMAGDIARVRLTCSAGFYVRTFAHSLGELVRTGACLQELRRTRSGEFLLAQAVDIETLSRGDDAAAAALIGMDRLLTTLPLVTLTDEGRNRVAHGQEVEGNAGAVEWVRLADREGHLVAMARAGSRPGSLHPTVVLI